MPEIEIPEIREIVAPLPPDTSLPFYIWIVVGVALIGILVLLIVLLRSSSKFQPTSTVNYDPRQSALTKLHELKENYLALPAPEFALQTSHGLREYLTSFYGSTTPYETGREFLERQDDSHLMAEQKYLVVRDLYERAERLKYAPAPGADSERLNLVEDTISFVRDDTPGVMFTVPNPSPPPENDVDPLPA